MRMRFGNLPLWAEAYGAGDSRIANDAKIENSAIIELLDLRTVIRTRRGPHPRNTGLTFSSAPGEAKNRLARVRLGSDRCPPARSD